MKVGFVHFMAYPSTIKGKGPVVETIRKVILDDYFNAIEITPVRDPAESQAVKKMLESSHMTVAYGAQPRLLIGGLKINDLDEDRRLAALENLKEGIDEAYEIGFSSFAFLSGPYQTTPKRPPIML